MRNKPSKGWQDTKKNNFYHYALEVFATVAEVKNLTQKSKEFTILAF